MRSGILNEQGTIQAKSNIFWITQLYCYNLKILGLINE